MPTDIRSLKQCNADWPDTVLIIGDKVVTSNCQSEYAYTLDLGEAWKATNWSCHLFLQCGKVAWTCQASQTYKKVFNDFATADCYLNLQHRIEQVVSANAINRGVDTTSQAY